MSHTPAVTPSRAKNLPLIVDIAIDNDGKQLYQVHETAKTEHKDMPRTSAFEKSGDSPTYNQSEAGTVYANLSLQNEGNVPLKSELRSNSNAVGGLELSYNEHTSALDYKQDANQRGGLLNSDPNSDFHSLADGKLPISVKKELDNLSPTSLERDHNKFDSYQPPQYYPYQSHLPDSIQAPLTHQQQLQNSYFYEGDSLNNYGQKPFSSIAHPGTNENVATDFHGSAPDSLNAENQHLDGTSKAPESDIWSDDVSEAFEEILAIIPKNGLNKIKISGRSCGRNELISDYIFTKTGKYRSRKQVSSHIQVIKNLGQKQDIIKLIKDGPMFSSEEERVSNSKKFEAIFSKINLNKSLGLNDNSLSASRAPSGGQDYSRKRSLDQLSGTKRQKTSTKEFTVSNFFISVYNDYDASPTTLCIQKDNSEFKNLKLKGDANISNRFPGLLQFQDSNIPIVHTMVSLKYPSHLSTPEMFETGLKTNISVQEQNSIPGSDGVLSVFSSVYSYGNEVLKFNEENFMLGKNHPFLHKFWLFYLSKLIGKSDDEVATALKSLTIKQIIFLPSKKQANSGIIPKLRIRAVLLWEFASAADLNEATTVSTKLLLPSAESLPLSYPNEVARDQMAPLAYQLPPEHAVADHRPSGMPLSSVAEYPPTNKYVPGGVNYTTVPSGYGPPGPASTYYDQPLGGSTIQASNQFQVQSKFQNLQEVANQNLSTRSASFPTVQQPLQQQLQLPLQPPPPPPPAQSIQPQMMPASFDNIAAMPMPLNDSTRYIHPSAKVDLMAATALQQVPPGGQPQVIMPEGHMHQPIGGEEVHFHSPPQPLHKEPIRNLAVDDGTGYKPVYYPDTYANDLA